MNPGVPGQKVPQRLNVGYQEATYSAGLLGIIAGFVVDRVDPQEAQAWADELRSLGPDYFFSLNRYLFSAVSRA